MYLLHFCLCPQMLMSFVLEEDILSYTGCRRTSISFLYGVAECYILIAMVHNHYVVVGKPLIYNVLLSPWICSLLVFGTYVMGRWGPLAHTLW